MIDLRAWKKRLRTPRGQYTLLAIALGGALGLTGVAIFFRAAFFERYVREKYPTPEPSAANLAAQVASGQRDAAEVASFSRAELLAVYGAWISQSIEDPHSLLAAALVKAQPQEMLLRMRVTAAAGSPAQRGRALELLPHFQATDAAADARQLGDTMRTRASRRKEHDLVEQASRAIQQLTAVPGDSS